MGSETELVSGDVETYQAHVKSVLRIKMVTQSLRFGNTRGLFGPKRRTESIRVGNITGELGPSKLRLLLGTLGKPTQFYRVFPPKSPKKWRTKT